MVATILIIFPKLHQPQNREVLSLFFSTWPRRAYFVNGPNAAASTAPTSIWPWLSQMDSRDVLASVANIWISKFYQQILSTEASYHI